jgi:hypothetical protein
MSWATFWATFSQTHLVTLAANHCIVTMEEACWKRGDLFLVKSAKFLTSVRRPRSQMVMSGMVSWYWRKWEND